MSRKKHEIFIEPVLSSFNLQLHACPSRLYIHAHRNPHSTNFHISPSLPHQSWKKQILFNSVAKQLSTDALSMCGSGPERLYRGECQWVFMRTLEIWGRINAHRSSHTPGICQQSLKSQFRDSRAAGYYLSNYEFWKKYLSLCYHI